MTKFSKILAAAAVLSAFAAPAFAQDTGMSEKQIYNVPASRIHNANAKMEAPAWTTNAATASRDSRAQWTSGSTLADRYGPAGGF